MRRRWTAVGVCLTLALAIGAAQQPSVPPADSIPSFRSGIDIVELDVSVLGKDRMPIRGLTAADFTVLEDGKAQPIVAFDAVDLPDVNRAGASWLRDVAPDVATNRRDAQRVVLILIDDCSVSFDDTRLTKGISHAVLDELGPADLSAVIYTFARDKGQEFTSDRTLLQAALDRFASYRPNPQPDSPMAASRSGDSAQNLRLAGYRGGNSGMCNGMPGGVPPVVQALENAAQVLRPWPGVRKTLVLVGTFGLSAKALEEPGLLDDLKTMFANLQEANINVYQYDPRGLRVDRQPSEGFGEFAENTGGRAITDSNTPQTLVPQMFRENSSYYLLGFRTMNPAQDGRFHRIAVKISRPDLEVRTRSGYFAPQPMRAAKPSKQPPSALDHAIAGGLPTGDLPMTLTVAPFAVPGKKTAALAIVAGIDATEETPTSEILEVRASAFQTDWKPAGSEMQKVDVQRPAPGASIHADVGSRLDLAPGRYEVRVAIDSPASGRTGSAYTTVIVPDFSKEPLALSGVVFARGSGSAAPGEILASLLPLAPTTMREFARSATAVAFVRIYQGGKAAPLPVQLTARLVNEADRPVFDRASTLPPAAFGTARSADYRLDLPLADLEPGRYLFTVEVTAGKLSSRRDVRLAVKP